MKSIKLINNYLKDSTDDQLDDVAIKLELLCESCYNKGYVETTHDTNRQHIEACDTCDYFGIIGDTDQTAREAAISDGYRLGSNGLILDEKLNKFYEDKLIFLDC